MGAVRLHDSLEYTSLYNLLAQNKMTTRVKRLQCVENLRTKQHIRQCIVWLLFAEYSKDGRDSSVIKKSDFRLTAV